MDSFWLGFCFNIETMCNSINRGWSIIRDWIAQVLAAKYLSP